MTDGGRGCRRWVPPPPPFWTLDPRCDTCFAAVRISSPFKHGNEVTAGRTGTRASGLLLPRVEKTIGSSALLLVRSKS